MRYLPSFDFFRSHNDHSSVFLINHVPKVLNGIRQTPLRRYVAFIEYIISHSNTETRTIFFFILEWEITS